MKKIITILLCALALSGCANKPTKPFDASEFIASAQKGTGKVYGEAFLKTAGGEVRYAAGNWILLIPVTPTTKAAWLDSIEDNEDPTAIADDWEKYVRMVTADSTGKFEFAEIPAGDYYLEVGIWWQTGRGSTGRIVKKQIHVDDKEPLKVILTS